MPCSQRKARLLLKENKAKIYSYNPFTIQLLVATGETVQDCNIGIDSGAKNIGFAITSKDKVFVKGEIELRQDVKDNLQLRSILRRGRRSRKTRYRKARFLNRTRKDGWLPPSVQSRVDNQINWINKLSKLVPNPKVIVEVGKFDAAKMINPNIQGKEYQQGNLYDYENKKAYIIARENNKCQICGEEYDGLGWHIHHIKQRKDGGSDRVDNLALVHNQCHKDFHQGKFGDFKFKKSKDYKETAFMNILRRQIFNRVECQITYGSYTKISRNELELDKTHHNDAIAISGIKSIKEDTKEWFKILQCRKKKRILHQANAYKGKKKGGALIKNTEQKRHCKNVKEIKGIKLNDLVEVNGVKGYVTGFSDPYFLCCNISGDYMSRLTKSGKNEIRMKPKETKVICHNNNWRYGIIRE